MTMATGQTIVGTPAKMDSLAFSGVNQAFFESIKKSSKETDKPIVISDEKSHTKLKEESISANKELKDEINMQYKKIGSIKGDNKELRERANEAELKVKLILLLNNKKTEYVERINKDKGDIKKIINELNSTKDSLSKLKALVYEAQSIVKNSLYQATSLYSLYDTTFTRGVRETIIKSLSPLSAQYNMSDENLKDLLQDIKSSTRDIDVALERSMGRDTLLNEYYERATSLINNTAVTSISSLQDAEKNGETLGNLLDNFYLKDVANWLQKSRNNFKAFSSQLIDIKKKYNNDTKAYDDLYTKYFVKKESVDETEFGAFPNISYLIGDQRSLNLNISVLGAYTKVNDDAFSRFEAKLFTGSIPKGLVNARSLFIPEVSSFGTQIKYVTGYALSATKPGKEKKQVISNFGGTFELNLLSKQLSSDISSLTATVPSSSTSTGLNNFVIHAKGGGELVILRDVFSVYSNLNWITLIDNTANFHKQFANLDRIDNKSSWVFFDIGCKLLLNPAGGDAKKVALNGLKIVADFDLIIPRMWGRQLINGQNDVSKSDMFLPLIKLGVRKSLGIIR